jgi:hypothetical protein
MDQGLDDATAHKETLKWQGIPEVKGYRAFLYDQSIIRSMSQYFQPEDIRK